MMKRKPTVVIFALKVKLFELLEKASGFYAETRVSPLLLADAPVRSFTANLSETGDGNKGVHRFADQLLGYVIQPGAIFCGFFFTHEFIS